MTTALMTTWILLLMVVVAVPAAWVMTRNIRGGIAALVAIAFSLSVCSAGIVSTVSWFTGLGLVGSILLHAGILVVLDVALVLGAGGFRKVLWRSEIPVVVMSVAAGVLAWWERAWMAPNMDVFYHIAAARSLQLFDSAAITDPFYGVGGPGPDPTAGAINVLLGMSSKVSGVDPAALWAGLNVFSAMLTPLVFWMLFRQLRASRWGSVVAVAALTFVQSSADFRFAAYPNRMGVLLMVVALAGLAGAIRGRRGGWAVAVVGAFAASATHTGVALTVLVVVLIVTFGMLVYARFAETDRSERGHIVRRVLIVGGSVVVATLAAVAPRLWFMFSAVGNGDVGLPSASNDIALHGLYRLFGVGIIFDPEVSFSGGMVVLLVSTAIALLSVPIAVRKRDHSLMFASIVALVPVLIGFNPVITPVIVWLSPYVAWRTLTLLGFTSYVMIPLVWKTRPVLARLLVVGALLSAAPALHMQFSGEAPVSIRPGVINVSVWGGWEFDARSGANSKAIGGIAEVFGEDWPIIATDEMTGYNMGGLLPCIPIAVTPVHAPAFMEYDDEGNRRREAMTTLLDPRTAKTSRGNLVREWDIDYVLLWPGRVSDETRHEMIESDEVFEIAYDYRKYTLLRVLPE